MATCHCGWGWRAGRGGPDAAPGLMPWPWGAVACQAQSGPHTLPPPRDLPCPSCCSLKAGWGTQGPLSSSPPRLRKQHYLAATGGLSTRAPGGPVQVEFHEQLCRQTDRPKSELQPPPTFIPCLGQGLSPLCLIPLLQSPDTFVLLRELPRVEVTPRGGWAAGRH